MGAVFSWFSREGVPAGALSFFDLRRLSQQGGTHHGSSQNNQGVQMGHAFNSTITGTQNIENYHVPPEDLPEPERLYDVPFPRNPKFYGRDSLIEELHNRLSPSGSTFERKQRSCLVHGIGGMGKTQFALEYTYRYQPSYDFIFWMHAETNPQLALDMIRISASLHLPQRENTSDNAKIEMVRTWFENTDKKWLIVFDNAQDSRSLGLYWPRMSTNGSILLTSQDSDLVQTVTEKDIVLKPFDKSESLNSLLKYLEIPSPTEINVDAAMMLCDELGGLPLVIAHVAGYIVATQSSIKETLELFKQRQGSADIFHEEDFSTLYQYERSLLVVWKMALQKLDGNELKLIQVLCMLNPDNVPEDMLYGDHDEPELSFLKSENSARFPRMRMSIKRHQLITIVTIPTEQDKEQNTVRRFFSTHRSFQRSVLHTLDREKGELQAIFEIAFTLLRKVFPRQSPTQFPQNHLWEVCEQYSPHIMSLRKVYKESNQPPSLSISIEFAVLLGDVANYFWERNLFIDALLACDTAENICETLQDRYPNQRADVYTVAACIRLHYGISKRKETLHRCQKALALRQQHLNELHPLDATADDITNYANAWGNLGAVLLDYEFYEEALPYLDCAIALRNGVGGEHGQNGQTEKDKSLALAALGRFDEAIALIPDDAVLENAPPDILKTVIVALWAILYQWATIYLNAGKIEDARTKMFKVLESRSKYFGSAGRTTLDTYYLMGTIEQKRGNPNEAEDYFRKALEQPKEWTVEAEARAQYHLGKLLASRNKPSEARDFQMKAQETKDKLWKTYATYIPEGNNLDDDAVYDHMVPMEAGRSTLAKGIPGGTPEMDKISRLLKDRVEAATANDVIIVPSEFVQLMRYDEDFPEEM